MQKKRMSKDMKIVLEYVKHFAQKKVMKKFQLNEGFFAWKSCIS